MAESTAAMPIPLDVDPSAGARISSPYKDRPSSRSASRPKSRGKAGLDTLFPVLSVPSAKSRHTGRRKKHRWENSRVLGSVFAGEVEEGEFDEDIAIKDVFKQDWSSLFKGLTPEEVEAFRECEGEEYERAIQHWRKTKVKKVKRAIANVPAEKRFCQMESKLRHHLSKVGMRMNGFLYDLEVFLLETLEWNSVRSEPKPICLESLPKRLQNALVVEPCVMLKTDPMDEKNLVPAVTLRFKSSFYRLLAHAVSQFHCLHVTTNRLKAGDKEMTLWNVLHVSGYEVVQVEELSPRSPQGCGKSWDMLDTAGLLESRVVHSSKGFGGCRLVSITHILAEREDHSALSSDREKNFYNT